MKTIFLACLLQFLLLWFISAQEAQNKPFAELEEYVKTQGKSWNEAKIELSKLFQKERNRLGSNFESELLKYLAADAEKYYWIAIFLESKAYLHGNPAMPELAFSIRQQGLKNLADKNDEQAAIEKIRLLIMAATSGAELGKSELAANYKREAETLLAAKSELKDYLPFLPDARRCFYENIGGDVNKCKSGAPAGGENSGQRPENSGEVVRIPKDSKKRKTGGSVKVEVVIDEDGNPLAAKAVEGPDELREAAVAVALQSKFAPAILNGKPIRVTRTIIYEFAK